MAIFLIPDVTFLLTAHDKLLQSFNLFEILYPRTSFRYTRFGHTIKMVECNKVEHVLYTCEGLY